MPADAALTIVVREEVLPDEFVAIVRRLALNSDDSPQITLRRWKPEECFYLARGESLAFDIGDSEFVRAAREFYRTANYKLTVEMRQRFPSGESGPLKLELISASHERANMVENTGHCRVFFGYRHINEERGWPTHQAPSRIPMDAVAEFRIGKDFGCTYAEAFVIRVYGLNDRGVESAIDTAALYYEADWNIWSGCCSIFHRRPEEFGCNLARFYLQYHHGVPMYVMHKTGVDLWSLRTSPFVNRREPIRDPAQIFGGEYLKSLDGQATRLFIETFTEDRARRLESLSADDIRLMLWAIPSRVLGVDLFDFGSRGLLLSAGRNSIWQAYLALVQISGA